MDMHRDTYVYRVDATDTIVYVSDNWGAFARANEWHASHDPEQVLNQTLWNSIADAETRHLYKELFRHVRDGGDCQPIPFRCDSPSQRRYLELSLQWLPRRGIELRSTILKTEDREPVAVIDRKAPRAAEFLRICSMCKKVVDDQDRWVSIEKWLRASRVFEEENAPRLTHGLCPDCFGRAVGCMSKAV